MDDCFIAAERAAQEGLSLAAVIFALRAALRVVGLDPMFMRALGQHPTDQLRARAYVTLKASRRSTLRKQTREQLRYEGSLWVWI